MVLSTDLDRDDAIPYFLWDDPMTVAELRHRLATASVIVDLVRDESPQSGLLDFVKDLERRLAALARPEEPGG